MKYHEFRESLFDNKLKLDYPTFLQKTNLTGFWDRLPEDDHRKIKFRSKDDFLEFYYFYFIENIDNILREFYRKRIRNSHKRFNMNYIAPISTGGFKLIRNLPDNSRYFRTHFNKWLMEVEDRWNRSLKNKIQRTCYEGQFGAVFNLPKAIYKDIDFDHPEKVPESLVVTLKTESGLPSIFSQNVYRSLLIYSRSLGKIQVKNLLCPTASWGVPVVATKSQDYKTVTIIDVIDGVLEKCHDIHKDINVTGLFDDDYELETICVPSERMAERLTKRYQQIFFCPPYFDLEQYNQGKQSTILYPTYTDWLRGYWHGTCIESNKVLDKGGTFTFVISNYLNGINIGDDMAKIASEYFTPVDEVRIETRKKNLRFESDNRYEKAMIYRKDSKDFL